MVDLSARRPLKSRDSKVFIGFAAWLARIGVSPNAISFTSILFGAGAGLAFAGTSVAEGWLQRGCWFGGALCIQFRLLANLFDGMVAVEGGKAGPTGGIWNEAPDRLADAFIFIGAGYAAGSHACLGWAAALSAVGVAYVRALGASLGAGQLFIGPQAKQQRMALLTAVAVLSAVFPLQSTLIGLRPAPWMLCALGLVVFGCAVTVVRRLRRISAHLSSHSQP